MRKLLLVSCSVFTVAAIWTVVHRRGSSGQRAPALATMPSTSRAALDETVASMRLAVAADPGDGAAAVALADALMRSARINADGALPIEAERVLRATLRHRPSDYAARRTLSVVYLSQHRFEEALAEATAAQRLRPGDAWNYAVAGDALLELGRYEQAFDAFDQVMHRRPDAGAYARVAYARELQGDLDEAVRLMGMAAESTSPKDVEALAWTFAQIGNLHLLRGRLDEAEREFERAEFVFRSHPYAVNGRIRLLVARHRFAEALDLSARAPVTPESLAIRGDLLARLGHPERAEAAYREAERLERDGWTQEQPQPGALARFLAERGRKIPEAIALAERAARGRQDIATLDALAWAYFQGGRMAEATEAIARATRLGTADPRIRCHESVIARVRIGALSATGAVCDVLNPEAIGSAAPIGAG